MKKFSLFILALLMFLGSQVEAMQHQAQANSADAQVEQLIPTPKSLNHANKLTEPLKNYLAQLQEAATMLVLQHQNMEFTQNFVCACDRTVESRRKLENFQFQHIATSNFEAYNAAHPENPINTPGFMITTETPEASVMYLRYQNLFTSIDINCSHLPLILNFLQSENPEVKENGRYLLSKLETTFHEAEQNSLYYIIRPQYAKPLAQYFQDHSTIPAIVAKHLSYLRQTDAIQQEWYEAFLKDRELHDFKAMLNASKTDGLDVSIKPIYIEQRDYDIKTNNKRRALIKIYQLKLDEIRQLYRALYQRLSDVCTNLKDRGIASGKVLIQYKKNGATQQALPEDLLSLGLPKPRNFADIVQSYKEKQDPYSFIHDQLNAIVETSKKQEHAKQLTQASASEVQSEIQLQEEVPLPVESTSASDALNTQKQEYQTERYTERYYVNEKNPLYVEIYDRQEQATFILYRVAHPDDTLINKPYVNFSYADRVTGWFTNPMDRLKEDGYTDPNHKYYTVPARYHKKIFIHAFSPLIDDYLFALGIETPSPYNQADKNVRILGEIQRKGKPTSYVYFTYNFSQDSTGNWICNHRCIEIQPKSEFFETKLNQARWDTNFPPLK